MATIGSIETFDPSEGDWASYSARLDHFITANDIAENKRAATLLTVVGSTTYRLLENLLAPVKPGAKSYEDLCKTLVDHLQPKPLVIAERYRFHMRNQSSGETVSQYLAELRRLARYCDFAAYLPQALRDRFVCGIVSQGTRRKLLAEKDLTLAMAETIAIAMETAARDASEVAPSSAAAASSNVYHTTSPKSSSSKGKSGGESPCYRCGGKGHTPGNCRFREAQCNHCGKTGHIKRVCRSANGQRTAEDAWSKSAAKQRKVHALDSDSEGELLAAVNTSPRKRTDIIWITPQVNGKPVKMELDTGSGVSIMPTSTFKSILPHVVLQGTSLVLRGYSGAKLKLRGMANVTVNYHGQSAELPVYVADVQGPALFGREWLNAIKVDWAAVHATRSASTTAPSTAERLQALKEEYAEIFGSDLGCLKGVKGDLTLQEGAKPKFVKARPLPYALRHKVEAELDRLTSEDIISPVEWSEWATPVVPVVKPDGSVRICGDFKVTVNPLLKVDQYPLPLVDDIFASLAGGKKFSKIDLRSAYTQMEMTDEAKPLLTLNTHRGLYRLNRLAFGVASAPAIWQRSIDQVLNGLERTKVIIDDIIVTGVDDSDHIKNLRAVFERLRAAGLRVKPEKCAFFEDEVIYCGHGVSEEGLRTMPTKVDAICKAPRPENVSQLRSFLGLVNYYQRFLPDLATTLHPLHTLLQKGKEFKWTDNCQDAFDTVKKHLASDRVLTHYNPEAPLRLASDASPYGLGAVLSHIVDGHERPIAFASRTLTPAERNYSQIDKEALAIVWALKRFHVYLFGRHFELLTDHKPLVSIFHPAKGIPAMTAARLQRFALFLSSYTYKIVYRSTFQHANADGMSRLPQFAEEKLTVAHRAVEAFHVSQLETLPITVQKIRQETQRHPVLSQVHNYVLRGWPSEVNDDLLRPYVSRQHELTIHDGCVLWGSRVVIPDCLRSTLLHELHEGHPGMVRMKALARSYLWWPGLDQDIEETARSCSGCVQTLKNPATAPLHPWQWPAQPWQRLHVDFAGPLDGLMWLIVVDAHSKWPEVMAMKSTTAAKTIDKLRTLFAQHGIPEQLVSDNGPQFVSEEFAEFCRQNGIRHIKSAPYHPATNGLAERFVQSFKNAMKASQHDTRSTSARLAKFLLRYRTTPHATTNTSPAMLLFRRPLRTRLDLVRPSLASTVQNSQLQQAKEHAFDTPRSFLPGDQVLVRDYRPGHLKWQPATVSKCGGALSYEVAVNGSTWRRHIDQMRPGHQKLTEKDTMEFHSSVEIPQEDVSVSIPTSTAAGTAPAPATPEKVMPSDPPLRRYPLRERKAPTRLDL